ncbi:polysaccharide deacetylase family protein [Pseudomonas sp. HY7a-MNA-CIBAN-0227]|uniref:polysaccharide deacetylase family protein n=1 Tax=Pseudomonas sp. HY7a-MNA-CIBAN-0227 TaxID=3140474 RepID=UPI00332E0AEC
MSIQGFWPASSVLAWLQQVLSERFGHVFLLDLCADSIRLGLTGDSSYIHIALDGATFARADSDIDCAMWDAFAEGWCSSLEKPIPAPGASRLPHPLIERIGTGHRVNYDILGLCYWMLSRREEVGRTDLDGHGRFPSTSSHGFQHGYLDRPIVDEWLKVLGMVVQRQWPYLELKQNFFSMKVSHDVDVPSNYGFLGVKGFIRSIGRDLLKNHDYKSVFLAPLIRLDTKHRLSRYDVFNTFEWIMDQSDNHGLISAFYFICGRTDKVRDADYEVEHPAIRELIRRIRTRGHEIGLHPSYKSYQRPSAILAEAQRLRRVCNEEGVHQEQWGGRMHYLRWDPEITLQAWEDAGMSYDSTLGYADRAGFRCGTCFEYPAFNSVTAQALQLRIRPLIAMECTVIDACYMGLGKGEDAFAKFIELKNSCKAVGGCFTLLWHNSQFVEQADRVLFQSLLG